VDPKNEFDDDDELMAALRRALLDRDLITSENAEGVEAGFRSSEAVPCSVSRRVQFSNCGYRRR
jgi:hypothetical protein